MEIYLIRHTKVAVPRGICYGFKDIALAETKAVDIAATVSRLPNDIQQLYSSPLSRCVQLAEAIGPNITYDERLKELNFGLWEGQEWSAIPEQDFEFWHNDFVHNSPPEGESYGAMYQRMLLFYNELLNSGIQKVGIVSHGGWIRLFLSHCLMMPLKHAFRIKIDYGSISKVSIEHQPLVDFING